LATGSANHWRVDLKWISGIFFTVILALLLAVLAMFQPTGRDQAGQSIAKADQAILNQAQFRQDMSLYAPQLLAFLESAEFTRTVYENPDSLEAEVNAVPDNAGLPQVPDGDNLQAGAAADQVSPVKGIKTVFSVYRLPLKFMSASVHQTLSSWLMVLAALSLLSGAALVWFSRGVGRVVSPSVSLALVSWPGLLFVGILRTAAVGWADADYSMAAESDWAVRVTMSPLIHGMFDPAASLYLGAAFMSLLLLLAAGAAALVMRRRES